MFSLYTSVKNTKTTKTLDVENYVEMIRNGAWQDHVLQARSLLETKGQDEYKKYKTKVPGITGSAVCKPDKRADNNIDYLNGLMVIDIDERLSNNQYFALKEDKYTHIIHKSLSGINYCVFVKIDTKRDFKNSYSGLGEYYYKNFDITIDPSCSNVSRFRFCSYDPDIFHNQKSTTFRAKQPPKLPKKQDTAYIHTQSDFDNILSQIKDRSLDLCQEDYYRYVRIGMAIANEFGISGEQNFHFVCQFGSKYNEKNTSRDYKGFCSNNQGECTIGTFYYYCKEAGLEIYSEKTKTIINRVKTSKSQGNPTVKSIASTLKVANNIEANDEDLDLIDRLIKSKEDYSKQANAELSDIEKLERFIVDAYSPSLDTITNIIYINQTTRLTDKEVNDIYISCKKNFDFNIPKSDVQSILHSSVAKEFDSIKIFISENSELTPEGEIDKYINCIHPQSDYNRWAFKKWIVGAVHNWISPYNETLVCPLTLVLTGQQHGTGKTSFLRNIMPKELRKYITEAKINGSDKDSMYTLCSSLLVFDDEFGGKAMKDVKEYKAISDVNIITQRRPYGRELETFKRRAILCGTTNEIDILKDVTGNRRILPIPVESVDYDTITSMDTSKLIMEAYNLLKNGFDWIIRTNEDIKYLDDHTQDNNVILPVEEIFFKYFRFELEGIYTYERVMNQGDILNFLLNRTNVNINKYDIREIMVKNKQVYKNQRDENNQQKKGIKVFLNSTVLSKDEKSRRKEEDNQDPLPF